VFEETGHVARYLLVPPECDDPADIMRVLLGASSEGGFGLEPPNMVIQSLEGPGYFTTWFDGLDDEDKRAWGQPCSGGDDIWRVARSRYAQRVEEILFAIVRAATESGVWFLLGDLSNMNGGTQGSIWAAAMDIHAQLCSQEAKSPVVLGLIQQTGHGVHHCCGGDFDVLRDIGKLPENPKPYALSFPTEVDLYAYSVELGQQVTQRAVIHNSRQFYMPGGDELRTRGMCINPRATHFIVTNGSKKGGPGCGSYGAIKLFSLLNAIAPAVHMCANAKSEGFVRKLYNQAIQGNQVIFLKHAGRLSSRAAQAIEFKRLEDRGQVEDNNVIPELLPPSAALRNFLLFDTVHDKVEDVVQKLTKALSAVNPEELSELGFVEAERHRLLQAWDLHILYKHNALVHSRRATAFQTVILVFSIATTLVSIVRTQEEVLGVESYHDELTFMCGVLPLLSGFFLTVNSRFAPIVKWAYLQSAATRITGEIYRYRSRVGQYTARGSDAFERFRNTSAAKKDLPMLSSRAAFQHALENIQVVTLSSELRLDQLYTPREAARADHFRTLYGAVAKEEKNSMGTSFISLYPAGDADLSFFSMLGIREQDDQARDDGISFIVAEDYVKFRLEPIIREMERQQPSLSRSYYGLHTILFILTTMSALLALLELDCWIPVVVAVSSAVATAMDYTAVQARLLNASQVLMALKNLLIWWESLSMVQKRLPINKATLVESAETAIEQEQSSVLKTLRKPQQSKEE